MANEEFFVTILALVIIGVLLYAFASIRYSYFAAPASDAVLHIVTKTGSSYGVTTLINEFDRNHDVKGPNPVFWKDVSSDTFTAVSFKQIKDTQLTSNEVHIRDGRNGTLIASFGAEDMKMLSLLRDPSKRLLEFISFLNLKSIPDNTVVALTVNNGNDPSKKVEYAIYVATKTYDKSIVQLVRALNERASGLNKVVSFKFTNPVPVRFYAATNGNLGPKQLAVYDNGSRVYISETRDLFLDDNIMNSDLKVNLFNKETGMLETIKCPRTVSDVKKLYPPTINMCNEQTSHCYLLRARAPLSDCHKAAEGLQRIENEYNKLKLLHGGGYIRFYSGGVEPYEGPSEIFAAIDSSDKVIRESMDDVYNAIDNPENFKPMVNRMKTYLINNMERKNPRQYV